MPQARATAGEPPPLAQERGADLPLNVALASVASVLIETQRRVDVDAVSPPEDLELDSSPPVLLSSRGLAPSLAYFFGFANEQGDALSQAVSELEQQLDGRVQAPIFESRKLPFLNASPIG